jgi:hypothetical protein
VYAVAASFAAATSCHAQGADDSAVIEAAAGITDAGESRWALIIVGHPGDDEHAGSLSTVAEQIRSALKDRFGFGEANIWTWSGVESNATREKSSSSRGPATRAALVKDVEELRRMIRSDDELWVFVAGHASYADRTVSLNLPGPDVSAVTFAEWFVPFNCRRMVFVLTTPLSGYFVKPLATPGRVVITATGNDLENNETLFPSSLAKLLGTFPDDEHDIDKDGRQTLLDLYVAVARDVKARYETDELLATEHAQIDDNGDGLASELQSKYPDGSTQQLARRRARNRTASDGALSKSIDLGEMMRKP